jgi:hypothetical protein
VFAARPEFGGVITRIEAQQSALKNSRHFNHNVEIPWSTIEERERNLFTAILKGYDLLKANNHSTRYTYLYEAVVAASKTGNARHNALLDWARGENVRMYSLGLSHTFYNQWKEIAAATQQAINQLNAPKPEVDIKEILAKKTNAQLAFLESIREDLKSMPASTATKPEVKNVDVSMGNNFQMIMMGLLAGTAFLFGFILRGGKKKATVRKVIRKKIIVPTSAAMVTNAIEENIPEIPASKPKIEYSVNLEEKATSAIEDSMHLFEIAGLKVHQSLRSPFNTQVNAPANKIDEALNWLIKGAIAVANTSDKKASHVEWNCKEQSGRVSLELVFHGIETDSKTLYLNALTDGEGSAPAHFGRTEMALNGHLASVGVKSGGRRTTVSLGLEARSNSMTH